MADLTRHSMLRLVVLASALAALANGKDLHAVTLATFDSASGTTFKWSDMNDPVMGGASKSTFSVEDGQGHFSGTCAIVPFLKAPGFCKISTSSGWFSHNKFADVSAFIDGALYLSVSSKTAYKGFKVAFGAKGAKWPSPGMHHGTPSFKAGFTVPVSDSVQLVKVPFNQFSVDWSEYTGDCDSKDPNGYQHVCCSADHPEVCPTASHLQEITSLEIWAEGVEGDFDLKILSIGAGPL